MPAKEPKIGITVKMSRSGLQWTDEQADTHESNRSEVIRAALLLASRHEKELAQILDNIP